MCECVCVCERERERERESVCVSVFVCVCAGVCVCERERERERESVCVCVSVFVCVCVQVCVQVCGGVCVGVSVCECANVHERFRAICKMSMARAQLSPVHRRQNHQQGEIFFEHQSQGVRAHASQFPSEIVSLMQLWKRTPPVLCFSLSLFSCAPVPIKSSLRVSHPVSPPNLPTPHQAVANPSQPRISTHIQGTIPNLPLHAHAGFSHKNPLHADT